MWTSLYYLIFSPLTGWLTGTYGIGIICIAVWFIAPAWLPFNRSNLLWAGIAALIAGSFYWYAFNAGEDHATQKIAADDHAAVERKDRAVGRVRSCADMGGTWDVSLGNCTR